jgi:hypothetical protein
LIANAAPQFACIAGSFLFASLISRVEAGERVVSGRTAGGFVGQQASRHAGKHCDGIASPSVMERRVRALRKAGTEVEFHRYRDLGHGFGPGIGTAAEGWLERAIRFWEKSIRSNEGNAR